MSTPVNIGLIGCGGMMGGHVKGYQGLWEKELRNFRVCATCDVEKGRAEKFADDVREFQGERPRVYTDFETMLRDEKEMQAVDISLVHREHHLIAIPCLEAGLHVTIEKPLAYTMRAAKAILDAARDHKCILQTAENYRRGVEHRAYRWLIENERIGKLRMMFCHQIFERQWYWTWRDHRDLAGGGWTMDGGVHTADLMRYLLGLEARRAYAVVRQYSGYRYKDRESLQGPTPVTIEDSTWCTLEFDQNVVVSWIVTIAAPGEGGGAMSVYGDKGSIVYGKGLTSGGEALSKDEVIAQFRESLSEEQRESFFPRGIEDTVAIELNEFINAVANGGGPNETDGLSGYKALALCFALYESAWSGQPVELADIEQLRIEQYQADLNVAAGF